VVWECGTPILLLAFALALFAILISHSCSFALDSCFLQSFVKFFELTKQYNIEYKYRIGCRGKRYETVQKLRTNSRREKKVGKKRSGRITVNLEISRGAMAMVAPCDLVISLLTIRIAYYSYLSGYAPDDTITIFKF
jgi:hypothetical protein